MSCWLFNKRRVRDRSRVYAIHQRLLSGSFMWSDASSPSFIRVCVQIWTRLLGIDARWISPRFDIHNISVVKECVYMHARMKIYALCAIMQPPSSATYVLPASVRLYTYSRAPKCALWHGSRAPGVDLLWGWWLANDEDKLNSAESLVDDAGKPG